MYQVDEHTISLLHFDDGIKDECGRTWVSTGATVSTDQKVFGNSSLAVDVGKYIYTDDTSAFDFTGEFTIEMWAKFTSLPPDLNTNYALFSQTNSNGSTINMCSRLDLVSYNTLNNGVRLYAGGASSLDLNRWYHLAIISTWSGTSNTFSYTINGKPSFYALRDTANIPSLKGTRACVGKCLSAIFSYNCIGYIDEFRISNIARTFTPTDFPGLGKELLVVTMVDGVRQEYNLTKLEVDAFVDWYNARSGGTGASYYVFNRNYDLSQPVNRKEYLAYDKIVDFDVVSSD